MADCWHKTAEQLAAVGRDEYVLAGNHLEQIRIQRLTDLYLHIQLFGNFPRQTLLRRFTQLDSPAGQLPLVALIEHQHHEAFGGLQDAFDGYREHGGTSVMWLNLRGKWACPRSAAQQS